MRKFNKGEKVVVTHKVTRRSKDWANGWADGMDDYIGNTYTVRHQGINGVYFEEDDGCFGFPPRSLRLIKRDGLYQYQVGDIVEVTHAMPTHRVWVKGMEEAVGGAWVIQRVDSDNTVAIEIKKRRFKSSLLVPVRMPEICRQGKQIQKRAEAETA